MILVTAAMVTVPSSILQVSYAQSNQDMQTVLNVHNQERGAVGVQPLTWSDQLAAGAQTWAEEVATSGNFDHDPVYTGLSCFQARTNPCYGENIAGFNPSLGPSAPGEGVSLWTAEKSNYNGQTNTCAAGEVCGHYTQMVWQTSREVGCATAPPGAGGLHYSVLVCRYNPPGNGPGLPYGGPAQAMGDEDSTLAPPLQEGVGGGGGGDTSGDGGGGDTSGDGGGGDTSGDGGGGDTSGDGGGTEN
jgi:Cysteine-rich secretory protein family